MENSGLTHRQLADVGVNQIDLVYTFVDGERRGCKRGNDNKKEMRRKGAIEKDKTQCKRKETNIHENVKSEGKKSS